MEITEVRVKLMDEPGERLVAFCSITLDDAFVVRDLKIIEGKTGPFVAMPSRKVTAHCSQCGCKNHLRASFCNQCGARCKNQQVVEDDGGRVKLHADIAHPINSTCREMIQQRLIAAFEKEKNLAKLPGYAPSYGYFDVEAPAVRSRSNQPPATAAVQVDGSERLRGPHERPADQSESEPSKDGEFGIGVFDQGNSANQCGQADRANTQPPGSTTGT